MPELPEVENVRRTLAQHLLGQRVARVTVHRPGIITGDASHRALLVGQSVTEVTRHGKQLAIIAGHVRNPPEGPRCVCVHLGMSGRMTVTTPQAVVPAHTHAVWVLEDGSEVRFIDPRRFGGLWTFDSLDALRAKRWNRLGDDALTIRPQKLRQGLARTKRALKAALLDQSLVAGLGNIYVDELLYTCRLHPTRPTDTLPSEAIPRIVRNMRALLKRAIKSGGSTLRNYTDANGVAGGYQLRHRVYGRGGQPCVRCGQSLNVLTVAGRTTVACERCQVPWSNSGW